MIGRIIVGILSLLITIVIATPTPGKNSLIPPVNIAASVAPENDIGTPKSTHHEISGDDDESSSSSSQNLPQGPSRTKPIKPTNGKTAAKEKHTKLKTTKTSPSSHASASLRRIKKEYKDAVLMGIAYDWARERLVPPNSKFINTNGSHNILCIGPLTTNLRHWHFSFRGCGMYSKGIYHGRILLPKDYPATPPRVQLWTPSGRFVPGVDICLSASSYHPESWTPRWTVMSLVQALRLHMLTNPQEIGGKISTLEETLEFARKSLVWRVTWRAGKTQITVDHARLLQQRALTMDSDEANLDLAIETPDNAGTSPDLDGEPSEQSDCEGSLEPPLPHAEHEKAHGAVSSPLLVEKGLQKKSPGITKKTKKSKKAERNGGVATVKLREEKPKAIQSVVLGISKVLASPTRLTVLSLVLLFWIIFIP